MAQWVRLCTVSEAPTTGNVAEGDAAGTPICLANVNGELHALDNVCPHRGGPLGQGWVEGNAVVCPWHSWAFNVTTGIVEPPEHGRVKVLPLKIENDEVLVNLD